MDVKCERCSTEYEFDDALVSGRGTTVKCTNCGHKFKIRRDDGDFSEDFWNVRTGAGKTLVFTSLRELQRAIQTHQVERTDMLSRGGLPPKAIGQIPELSPFFDQREREEEQKGASGADSAIVARAGSSRSSRPPPPPGSPAHSLEPPRARHATRPDFPAPPAPLAAAVAHAAPPVHAAPAPREAPKFDPRKTLSGTGPLEGVPGFVEPPAIKASAPPPATLRDPEPPQHSEPTKARSIPPPLPSEPAPRSRPTPPPPASADAAPRSKKTPAPAPAPTPLAALEVSSPLPTATAPVLRSSGVDPDEYSDPMRAHSPSLPDAPPSMGRRRSVGGFIVVAVLLASAALIGAVWARDHLGATLGISKPAPAPSVDPRAATFLAAGEKALSDGNLDLAKESFDKASALAERDPRVLLDVARLTATRADVSWLKARLLPADAADEQRFVRDGLGEFSAAARKAADDALAVAPDDPSALRAKIDALRIAGDRDGARGLVSRVSTSAAQPESAYVLAALDLAEAEPLWSTVIGRLRLAASAETGPGRARAALVYALARSGDAVGAKSELDRLEGMPRRHLLFPLLRAFVERQSGLVKQANGGIPEGPSVAASASTKGRRGAEPGGEGRGGGGGGGALSADPRVLDAQGETARAKGDYDRAQMLFAAALDKNANDTEALSGLAAIAHVRRDLTGARASYKRVLSINPSYVPALVGVGDCDWESGDRASAMRTYKEIVDRFPEGTYPPRVKQRLDSAGPAPPAPTESP